MNTDKIIAESIAKEYAGVFYFDLKIFKEILAKVGNTLQFRLVNIIEGVLLFLSLKDY